MFTLSNRYTLLSKFRLITVLCYGRLHRTFYRNFDCTIPRQALHSSVSVDNMLSNGPILSILCYRNFDSILSGVICLSLLKGSSLLEVSTP